MNSLVQNWLIKENIYPKNIKEKVDCKLGKISDVNPIAERFGIYKSPSNSILSIGDIIGFENDGQTFFEGRGEDIFEELELLFNESGNEYSSRSNSMLDYSKEEILEKLKDSFENQPIRVKDAGDGYYSIAGNGKHRYCILRTLYLSELANIDNANEKEILKLKEKYKVPVELSEIDYPKTYANFFIQAFGFYDVDRCEINQSPTASIITWQNEPYGILQDSSLIKLANRIFQKNKEIYNEEYKGKREPGKIVDYRAIKYIEYKKIVKSIKELYSKIPSFRDYINENMSQEFIGNGNQSRKENSKRDHLWDFEE